jgi:hypothetical protein
MDLWRHRVVTGRGRGLGADIALTLASGRQEAASGSAGNGWRGCDSGSDAARPAEELEPLASAYARCDRRMARSSQRRSSRRIVKLPVRPPPRRHLHPYPRRLPSRSEPARCRLLCDFAHTASRGKALTPPAPGRASAARCGRTTRSRVLVRPFRGDACDRRGTRGWRSRSVRLRRSPIGGTESTHSGSSSPGCGGRPPHPRPEIESPGSASSRLREWAPSVLAFPQAPRGSSPFTDELLPTFHAIVPSFPSLLYVALFTAASRGDPWIHHLATSRAKRHRRVSTPMIHVGTQTPRHEPLSPLQ